MLYSDNFYKINILQITENQFFIKQNTKNETLFRMQHSNQT